MTREEMWKEFENQLISETRTPITMSFDNAEKLTKLGIKETVAKWKRRLEQTSWISVSERLPDIHNCFQECLITNKHKSVYKAFFTDINGKQWWSVDDVIAWMPLPKPYKAESEGSDAVSD